MTLHQTLGTHTEDWDYFNTMILNGERHQDSLFETQLWEFSIHKIIEEIEIAASYLSTL